MAACRLIALHINKGKTIAQCLADRTDYSQNAEKTNGGEYISSYECDPETADQEFLLSKRQYLQMTGRTQEHDVIAYQIRQSFKPGEITPEEANEIGYELAMRFTAANERWLARQRNKLELLQKTIELHSPMRILKQGYTLTLKNGKPVTSASALAAGDQITTEFADGIVTSTVNNPTDKI